MFGGSFNDLAFNIASEDAINIVDMKTRLLGEG